MLLASDVLRGFTDTIILAYLVRGDSYGYAINKSLARLSGGAFELKEATLYTSFRRMEESGLIRSYWGEEGAGARRRYYAVTPEGERLYRENLRDWSALQTLLNAVFEEEKQ
ncbi:MAG: PadR family transcriptional regulator [Oscillospiraceae bacterium]|nr:PadR family transcriptional regulator [Oscillospiraceae bacterium]